MSTSDVRKVAFARNLTGLFYQVLANQQQTKGKKMKILLAGMQSLPNQFSRGIEAAGCEVVWTNPDPGAFPRFCEAAVIAKCHLSHQKFWDVKEDYRKQNKPIFVSDASFVTIKEAFIEFVGRRRREMITKTTLGQAFVKAEKEIASKAEVPKLELAPTEYNWKHRYEPGVKDRIEAVIIDCMAADMSIKDTIEMLKADNLTMANGKDFNNQYICNLRFKLKDRVKKAEKVIVKHVPPSSTVVVEPPKPPQPVPVANEMALINRVLDLRISAEKKVEMLDKIRKNQISLEQVLWFIDTFSEVGT